MILQTYTTIVHVNFWYYIRTDIFDNNNLQKLYNNWNYATTTTVLFFLFVWKQKSLQIYRFIQIQWWVIINNFVSEIQFLKSHFNNMILMAYRIVRLWKQRQQKVWPHTQKLWLITLWLGKKFSGLAYKIWMP